MVGLRRRCAPRNDGVGYLGSRNDGVGHLGSRNDRLASYDCKAWRYDEGWLDCDVAALLAMTGLASYDCKAWRSNRGEKLGSQIKLT